jgi:hypothetical protein
MNEPAHSEPRDSLVHQPVDFSADIASLRLLGADKFDPVHFHYLQALVRRADTRQGSVKRILDGKLAQALTSFKTRFEHAQRVAKDTVDQLALQHPQAAADLQRRLKTGDFKGLRQSIAALEKRDPNPSLGELVRHLAQQSPEHLEAGGVGNVGLRPELKTARVFRNTWSKLSVDKRVTKALAQAPKNAGPINSHSLVLRSLALMREVSPDYLNRFTSYVDTLLCLEQGDQDKPAHVNPSPDGEKSKKKKSRRSAPKPS